MSELNIYFVIGEQSGDDLGADLLPVLQERAAGRGQAIRASGLAGPKLKELGVDSLFDIEEIAVMGLSAVAARLPKIIRRVYQTVDDIVSADPDLIVLIDSPDFTHAVAKRVRKRAPHIPVVDYICPSVWAWRSGRAAKMSAYIDHVLAILPFEPQVLGELGGPKATYIGHPLARRIEKLEPGPTELSEKPTLLVLPGSRSSEIKRLIDPFREAVGHLHRMGQPFEAVMPTLPHLRDELARKVEDWPVHVEIVDSANNDETFSRAHAALAASGTVALQLALHRVPMTLAYRLDPVARQFMFLISSWSAALPNLIAGWPVVPEAFNDQISPERMARMLRRLLNDTPERAAQLAGFDAVANEMRTRERPAERAADVIFDLIGSK